MDPIVLHHSKLLLTRRGYTNIGEAHPQLYASNADGKKIVMFFVEHTKVTVDVIKTIIATSRVKDVIIVHSKPLTPDAKQAVNVNNIFRFETFTTHEMSYDPIEIVYPHSLFTDHVPEKHKLPIILSTDIIARYYGFKKGCVVLVDEDGKYVLRRCV